MHEFDKYQGDAGESLGIEINVREMIYAAIREFSLMRIKIDAESSYAGQRSLPAIARHNINALSIGKPRLPVKQKQTTMNIDNLSKKQGNSLNSSPETAMLGKTHNAFPKAI